MNVKIHEQRPRRPKAGVQVFEFLPGPQLALLNYILALVNLGACSFMIPFRIIWTQTNGYKFQQRIVHKSLCIVVQVLIFYEVLTSSWFLIAKQMRRNSNNYGVVGRNEGQVSSIFYVKLVQATKCAMICIVFIWTFWIKKINFLQIIKKIQAMNLLYVQQNQSLFTTKALAYGICVFSAAWAVAEVFGLPTASQQLGHTHGAQSFFEIRMGEARQIYLWRETTLNASVSADWLAKETNNTDASPYWLPEFTPDWLDYFATILHIAVSCPHYICVNSADKCVLLLAICCRSVVIDFIAGARRSVQISNELTTLEKSPMKSVLAEYGELKQLMAHINSCLGPLLLCFTAACLPLYPLWSGIIFTTKDTNWFQFVQFFVYFGFFFLILAVAADLNLKMAEFYGWLSRVQQKTLLVGSSDEQFGGNASMGLLMNNALMVDIQLDPIVLRGGGFFKMNYSFFGTVLGVIVTYTIIIIQFQTKN